MPLSCVCLFDASQYCVKTAKLRMKQTSHDSPQTPASWCRRSRRNSNWVTPLQTRATYAIYAGKLARNYHSLLISKMLIYLIFTATKSTDVFLLLFEKRKRWCVTYPGAVSVGRRCQANDVISSCHLQQQQQQQQQCHQQRHDKVADLVGRCWSHDAAKPRSVPALALPSLCPPGALPGLTGDLWLCAVRGCRRTATELPVAASRVWNSLPHHVTSAQSLPVFCSRLKTYLFRRSFPRLFCRAREVTLVIVDTLIVLTYLLTLAVILTCIPTPEVHLRTAGPWLLTVWPQAQCMPRSCHGVCVYQVWCW